MLRRTPIFAAFFAIIAPLSFACAAPADDEDGASEDAIIGGVDARGASLDAVGALAIRQAVDGTSTTELSPFCTATLITPRALVTAKHCVLHWVPEDPATGQAAGDVLIHEVAEVVFAIGHDARNPKRTVRVASAELCNEDGGGFAQLGCDVAVYHLAEAVEDVTPIPFATTAPDDQVVGKKHVAVGYGLQDAQLTSGTRKAGSVTVRAIRGTPLQEVFPTFEEFLEAYSAAEGATTTEQARDMLDALWNQPLLDDYELWAGNAEGDAQVCDGDSGGPLLAKVNGKNVVLGVASTAVKGIRLPCNLGGSYATFGPKAQEILSRAENDPCEGIDEKGKCDDTIAIRCTSGSEGARRLTRFDCADLGQRCAAPEDGRVECVD